MAKSLVSETVRVWTARFTAAYRNELIETRDVNANAKKGEEDGEDPAATAWGVPAPSPRVSQLGRREWRERRDAPWRSLNRGSRRTESSRANPSPTARDGHRAMPRAVIPSITTAVERKEVRGAPVLSESRARWSVRRTSNATFASVRFASDSSILSQCRVTSRSCGSYDAKVK